MSTDPRWRPWTTPHLEYPTWLTRTILAGVGVLVLLLIGAVTWTLIGTALDVDAAPIAQPVAALALFVGLVTTLVATTWMRFQNMEFMLGRREEDPYPADLEVPERAAIQDAQRRRMAARIAAQRAGRNQTPASGGSVSSTEAGRPFQGSSDATTEP